MSKSTETNGYLNFYRLFIGQGLASLLSTTVNYVLVFYLTTVSHAASILTIGQIISLVPIAVLSPLSGILIDRISKKKILVLSDVLVGVITFMLCLNGITTGGRLSIGVILFSNFLRSVALSVQNPATQSAIPELVSNDELLKVNGYYSALNAMLQLLPPIIGGVIYGLLPLNGVLLLSVIANILGIIAVLLTKFPVHTVSGNSKTKILKELKNGFSVVYKHTSLFHLLTYKVISIAVIMPTTVLYPLMTFEHFHGSLTIDAPIVELSLGLGMLCSGLSLTHLIIFNNRLVLTALGILMIVSTFLISGFLPGNRFGFILFVAINFVGGFALPLIDAPIQTIIQETIPKENLGKAISLFISAIGLAGPIGLVIGTFWTNIVSVSGMFITSGIGMFSLLAIALLDKQLYKFKSES